MRRTRRRKQLQLTLFAGVALTLLLVIFFINLSSTTVLGSKDIEIQYLSVEVQENDTLWNLALEFQNEDYMETHEYIEEIQEINALHSETIYAGQRILIPVIN